MLVLQSILVSVSIASMLTAVYAFRYRAWDKKLLLAGYFALFFAIEWAAESMFIPAGALGVEVGYVCFAITALFVLAGHFVQHLERLGERSSDDP